MRSGKIVIRGAREHNLKDIDLEIPRNRLVVITGLSGSGKSSLAFDTIYAEGQRRYVESLSAYARQFLEQMDKPDVDSIEGLSPAISIEQKSISKNPRSTVGTVTEIYDYLRLLFARAGTPHCYRCGKAISSQTIHQMVDRIMELPEGAGIQVLAPIVRGRKGEYRKELNDLLRRGYVRVRVDGEVKDLEEEIVLDKRRKHDIEVVVDRLIMKPSLHSRLADSLETALELSDGLALIDVQGGEEIMFSERFACIECGVSYPEISPRMFSFNSPHGACTTCNGLGSTLEMDHDLIMPGSYRARIGDYVSERPCKACGGARLRPESLSIKVEGMHIGRLTQLSVKNSLDFFENLSLPSREEEIARRIMKEVRDRLRFLVDVGLDYLTLDRPAATLSGGEGQRIKLATQIGSSLVGVLYILDEPTIGLHQRDNQRLLTTLKRLRDLGNTVIVVEHDRDTILSADYVIDLGPGAGERGGYLVAGGPPQGIIRSRNSLTGKYLAGKLSIEVPPRRRKHNGKFLKLLDCSHNNLKNIDVKIPLGLFTCITGVSGSGKSTLLIDILYRALMRKLYRSRRKPGRSGEIRGIEQIDKVIDIDQSPIGRTPRSNSATYTGLFTIIRELYSQVPEARARGYRPGRFSFNVKGGRCEACRGDGTIKIEMHFLPDIYVKCDLCKGLRFNRETLDVRYKGKNIADVLEMSITQALEFFTNIPRIQGKLKTMHEVGLGYIRLGQPATTLSGGEAQRVKLAKELSKRSTGRTLYILDEPTTGLHFDDIKKLLEVLNRLTDAGNTIMVIEHNMEVVKTADYIIDLGPEGGENGGWVVATGTPEEVAENPDSYTGHFLSQALFQEESPAVHEVKADAVAS